MVKTYDEFLKSKSNIAAPIGIRRQDNDINSKLYDFQKAIVKWALRKGRAAVFADCGLGKTFIQIEWARLIGERILIVAPLCVAKQTIDEAKKLDVDITFARDGGEINNG